MRKTYLVVLLSLSVVLMLSGCSEQATEAPPADAGGSGSLDDGLKAAILLPGSANDQSWSQLGFEGLQAIGEALGAETAYSENVAVPDAVDALRDYAGRGFDLVITHGGQYEEAALRVGEEFPDSKFVVIAGSVGNDSNVTIANINDQQLSYTRGIVAGRLTKTKKIGLVSHLEGMPVMIRTNGAWRMGIKAVDPEIEVCLVYLEDGEDVAAGREAALALFESGADIVEPETNRATQGVVDAAIENGFLTSARDPAEIERGPEVVMYGVDYGYNRLFTGLAEGYQAGQLQGGSYLTGYDTPGAGFEVIWNTNIVTQEILDEIEDEVIPFFLAEPWLEVPPVQAESGCQ